VYTLKQRNSSSVEWCAGSLSLSLAVCNDRHQYLLPEIWASSAEIAINFQSAPIIDSRQVTVVTRNRAPHLFQTLKLFQRSRMAGCSGGFWAHYRFSIHRFHWYCSLSLGESRWGV